MERVSVVLNDRLSQIAADLRDGEPSPAPTVREFLGWIGAERRGYWITRVLRNGLAKNGLVTQPDFESAYLGSSIVFALAPEVETEPPVSTEPEAADVAFLMHDAFADPSYSISKLLAANQVPVSVTPDDPIAAAVTQMMINDFSQLPVMTNERDVKGVVSMAGVGRRMALGAGPGPVREFMDDAIEVIASMSLFDVLSVVSQHDYVLVRGSDRRIQGIVTASDLSLQFQQLTEPFLLLGEIENHIRRVIADRFSLEDVLAACDQDDPREIEGVDDLTFGEYIRLLEDPNRWAKLDIGMDRKIVVGKLEKIRGVRNDVMHFDPDGITPDALELLRDFAQFLRKLQKLGAV